MTHKGTVFLETERIILRRFILSDLEPMFCNVWSNFDVWKWTNYEPMNSIDDVLTLNNIFTDYWFAKYEKSDYYNWAIQLRSSGEVIGRLRGINPNDRICQIELAYELGQNWWNQGLMTEAVNTIIGFFIKEVGFNRIYAAHAHGNPASGKVMQKCELIYEGTARQMCKCNNGVFDMINYAILADDYFNRNDNQTNKSTSNIDTIKRLTELMFQNLWISIQTVDWNTDICGVPAWRYIYHTLHSADKFFINPTQYTEPLFHTPKLDWPDTPSEIILDRETLYDYYEQVRQKILDFLDGLTDNRLTECPNGKLSRLGLILSQFRHMYAHIGILNGVTMARTNKYPRVLNESRKHPEGLYDEDVR